MTPDERLALLGADVVAAVRAEARCAADRNPPGPEVIDALRPILTSRPAKKRRAPARVLPVAA